MQQLTPLLLTQPIVEKNYLSRTIIASLLFHVLVLVVIPLSMKFLSRSTTFVRPDTFTLVTLPASKMAQVRSTAQPKEKAAPKKPVPAPKNASAKTKEKPQPAEQENDNLDELNELLGDISTPAEVSSAAGNFKYNWYLLNVQQKIEQNWNPPLERENATVTAIFDIFRDGSISNIRISQSSGGTVLVNLATRAITLAAPFGNLPPGFDGDRVEISCTLRPIRK